MVNNRTNTDTIIENAGSTCKLTLRTTTNNPTSIAGSGTYLDFDTRLSGLWGNSPGGTQGSASSRGAAPAAGRISVIKSRTLDNYEHADMIFHTCFDAQPDGTGGTGVLTERMRITSLGNVGIRVSNPQVGLDVLGAGTTLNSQTNVIAQFTDGNTGQGVVIGSITGNTPYIGDNNIAGGNGLQFRTSNVERMRIAPAGSVGVNVNPSGTYNFQVGGTIYASGDITSGSDSRFKANVSTIQNPLSTITQLRGVTYTNLSTNTQKIGLIAQEVEKVLPEVVTTDQGAEQYKSLAYGNIVAVLVEAVKELSAKVDSLLASR